MRTERDRRRAARPRAAAIAALVALAAAPPAVLATDAVLAADAAPAGAAVPDAREETAVAIEERFMCHCGCTDLTVRVCNCGVAAEIKGDIRDRLAAGQSRAEVEAAYVARFGEQILSAPIRRGFNLMAWIMPFAAVLAAGAMVVVLVRRWGARPVPAAASPGAAPPPGADPASLERVDRAVRDLL